MNAQELYMLAGEYQHRQNDAKKAAELYRRVISEFPGSEQAGLAKAQLDNLRRSSPASTVEEYASTYKTSRAVASIVSFVGWVILAVGIMGFLWGLADVAKVISETKGRADSVDILSLLSITKLAASFAGIVSGLLIVSAGQITRAVVDAADNSGAILSLLRSR
jgi:hypothetical protein